jgi:ATP-dependent exoDNAse (exonuclease V) alpha subunit
MNFNIEVASRIIQLPGCFVNGPPGTGKTALINEMVRLTKDYNVLRLTPTNVSAILIGGTTIDKFANSILNNFKSLSKLESVDYIFVDEVGMMKELFYSVFLSVKYQYLHIKFIFSGDYYQLLPVCDRKPTNNQRFNYEHSKALYELVNGNTCNLTKCRRSDDKVFNLSKCIRDNQPYDIYDLQYLWTSYTNLSFTNEKRHTVNKKCMDKFIEEYKPTNTYKVTRLIWDERLQTNVLHEFYTLCKDMPLIARLNKKDLDIVNNEMFKCHEIKKDTIIIKNEFKLLEIKKEKFNKLFDLAFCVTIHKSQGMTLNDKYVIYEWEKLDKRLRYVAISRATNINNISIM